LRSWRSSLLRLQFAGILLRAWEKCGREQVEDRAAALAYFSFFSLFPLLLGIIAAGSFYLDSDQMSASLGKLLVETLPGSGEFVRTNLDTVIRLRGPAGLASIVALFWSARRMFGTMSRGINGILGDARPHAFYVSPIRSLLIALAVSLLLFLAMGVSMALQLLAQRDLGGFPPPGFMSDLYRQLTAHVTSFLFVFAVHVLIYRIVPYQRLGWRLVASGAALAALLFEAGKSAFVFYLNGVANLEAIYGSVSSIIVLLLWLYYSARVILLGAAFMEVKRRLASTESEQVAPSANDGSSRGS
jgi:membrane protein